MTRRSSSEIAEAVRRVRHEMEEAAVRAGRDPAEITLVGVTKTRTPEEIRAMMEAGVDAIGENKVQELLDKAPHLADMPHKTHLIGHLQRNKAKYLPGHIDMLQSLDSVKTLDALQKAYGAAGETLDVLIEVNIGDEESKTGVAAEGLEELAGRVLEADNLQLRGLMAIPPVGLGEGVRVYFEQMRQLFVDMQAKKMDNGTVTILSMGMSDDFPYAIAEGATMIRVGTDLFGPRDYSAKT